MDRSQLIAGLDDLKRDLAEADRRAVVAQAEADALRSIIDGIQKLAAGDSGVVQMKISVSSADGGHLRDAGTVEIVNNEPVPRGTAAIRQVMSDGRAWKQQALIAEIIRRGWIKPGTKRPDAAIREAVRRMASRGEVVKLDHATYRLANPPDPPIEPTLVSHAGGPWREAG
jgi:hypothetical protein